jgi:hypothetical protein
MQKILLQLLLAALCLLLVPWSLYGTTPAAPLQEGGPLPNFTLNVPESAPSRQYLGLDNKATFKIPEIDAAVVIIEIFSMY